MKTIKLFLIAILVNITCFGQHLKLSGDKVKNYHSDVDVANYSIFSAPQNQNNFKMLALWDVQFVHNANTASNNTGGQAAAIHIGSEFWLSKWASDTLIRVANDGTFIEKFTISGVSGVRALTWNGEFLYAGQNTGTVAVIDPSTKTKVADITVNSSVTSSITGVRHITYVASADGGNGGFYVGNFGTPIYLISKDGATVLQTIPQATHQQTGMYGSAYDTLSPDGPHLWVFTQNNATTQNIIQLNPSTGEPTGVFHNTLVDVGTQSTGAIAGGLFISPSLVSGKNTIGGLLQGSPNVLFGYELDEFILPEFEARLVSYKPTDEYPVKPLFMNPVISFEGKVSNLGDTPFDTLYLNSVLYDQDEVDLDYNTDFITGLSYPDSTFLSGNSNFVPTQTGVYTSKAEIKLWNGIMDDTYYNDTASTRYIVTDSTYSRTYFEYTSSLGIGNGTGGFLGNKYNFTAQTKVSSVTFRLNAPTVGDSVFVQVSGFSGSNPNNTLIVRTNTYIIQSGDENGVWITLPLRGGPRTFNAGNYMFSVREYNNNATISTNDLNWRPNTSYVRIGTGTWGTIESYNFKRTYLISLNLVAPAVGVNKTDLEYARVAVYPNPAKNTLFVEVDNNATISINNLLGQVILSQNMTAGKNSLNISEFPKGIYTYSLKTENGIYNNKIMILE